MTFSFHCPQCQATFSGSNRLAGRKVRCPQCESLVEAQADSRGTVALMPPDEDAGKTVLLEAVEVKEALALPPDASHAIEVMQTVDEGEAPPPPPPPPRQPAATAADAEAPRVLPRRKLAETEMDMTPMVDVTFLLLIFFMVTATFTLQKSLEIPKTPDEDPSQNVVEPDPDDQSDFVTVLVDEFGAFRVTTVEWAEEAPSVQDLYIHLKRAREGDSTGTIPNKLRVEAHGDALHEKVVAALDAGAANEFQEVHLTTIEDD